MSINNHVWIPDEEITHTKLNALNADANNSTDDIHPQYSVKGNIINSNLASLLYRYIHTAGVDSTYVDFKQFIEPVHFSIGGEHSVSPYPIYLATSQKGLSLFFRKKGIVSFKCRVALSQQSSVLSDSVTGLTGHIYVQVYTVDTANVKTLLYTSDTYSAPSIDTNFHDIVIDNFGNDFDLTGVSNDMDIYIEVVGQIPFYTLVPGDLTCERNLIVCNLTLI